MNHIEIKKEKGYKNKKIAQSVGIAIAKSTFELMNEPRYQGFNFDWKSYDGHISRAESDLFLYYNKKPKNIQELKDIAANSAKIEWNNLLDANKNNLTVISYSKEETIDNILKICTDSFIKLKQVEFYAKQSSNKVKNIEQIWKQLLVEEYSVRKLLEEASLKAESIYLTKNVSEDIQVEINKKIENYYNSIEDLKNIGL